MKRSSFVFAAFAALCGCHMPMEDASVSQGQELAQYDQLAAELQAGRGMLFEHPAQDFQTAGDSFFWVIADAQPKAHRYDDDTGRTLDYDFIAYTPTHEAEPWFAINYVASTSTVVSMNLPDGVRAYASDAANTELGEFTVPAPPYGAWWWPYWVDGDVVYLGYVDYDQTHYRLHRWTPGNGDPVVVADFDDLLGANGVDPYLSFAVTGSTLIFVSSNTLWVADLTTGHAQWTQNGQEVNLGAIYDTTQVIYAEGTEIWRYDIAADRRENLSDRIRQGYRMNDFFDHAHFPATTTEFTKRGSTLYYLAEDGIFSFDMTTGDVAPVLLNARDNSTTYRYPNALENGKLFVKGLQSNDGAIGADGPMYFVAPFTSSG